MTAERLRQAAAKLREVESDATHPDNMYPWGDRSLPRMTVEDWAPTMDGYLGGAWGVFAGVLSPPVALALAEWLEYTATIITADDENARGDGCKCPYCLGIPRSEAVAEAILGKT